MVKHLVLGVVVALIVTACSSADAGLFRRRSGCPGGKCGVPAKSASTQTASTTQIAAAR